MIDIEESFVVAAGPRTVWGVISEPRTVVGCVPGASLGDQQEDGSWDANVAVKFGPVRVTLQARVALELDDADMVGHATARGKDTQGGTRFNSTMTFKVMEDSSSGSNVAIDGQVELSGKLAGLIETGAPVVVGRMTKEFADNLARRCAEAEATATPKETQGDAG